MKITNNFIKTISLSVLLAAGTTACTRKPYVKMPEENISEYLREEVDTYRKESQDVLNDTTYEYYGKDTVLWDKYFAMNADQKARKQIEQVVIGSHIRMNPVFSNGKSIRYIPQTVKDTAPKYIDHKVVVKDGTLFTTDSVDIYIPVEFYGRLNPKIKNIDRK